MRHSTYHVANIVSCSSWLPQSALKIETCIPKREVWKTVLIADVSRTSYAVKSSICVVPLRYFLRHILLYDTHRTLVPDFSPYPYCGMRMYVYAIVLKSSSIPGKSSRVITKCPARGKFFFLPIPLCSSPLLLRVTCLAPVFPTSCTGKTLVIQPNCPASYTWKASVLIGENGRQMHAASAEALHQGQSPSLDGFFFYWIRSPQWSYAIQLQLSGELWPQEPLFCCGIDGGTWK